LAEEFNVKKKYINPEVADINLLHCLQAESAVLGNLVSRPYLLEEAIVKLKISDFYILDHQDLYSCFMQLFADGVKSYDMIIVANKYAELKDLSSSIAFATVAEIANSSLGETCFPSYIDLVLQKSKQRQTLLMLDNVKQSIYQNDPGALDALRNGLTKLENDVLVDNNSYSTILSETLLQIERISENPNELVGISSGYVTLDSYTNGFQAGQLIVIGARTSVGKSVMMLNMAEYIGAVLAKPTLIFSMEMSSTELTKRTLTRMARVKGIFSGKVTNTDWLAIHKVMSTLDSSKLMINDKAGMTVNEIRTAARKAKSEHGFIGAIFIDYLGLMRGDGENETLRLGNITRELKILAKDIETPIILLSQLNRELEKRANSFPMLTDLRQSGAIEQDADIVILLHRALEDRVLNVNVAKNRNGQVGQFDMTFVPEYFEFREFAK
jgi:replicative DNA helicase